MTAFYWPFFTQYDYYKIGFLVTVSVQGAFEATINRHTNMCLLTDRYGVCHSMGFVFDPQSHLDIPRGRHHRTYHIQNTHRRNILLLHSNLQHIHYLFHTDQTSCVAMLSSYNSNKDSRNRGNYRHLVRRTLRNSGVLDGRKAYIHVLDSRLAMPVDAYTMV